MLLLVFFGGTRCEAGSLFFVSMKIFLAFCLFDKNKRLIFAVSKFIKGRTAAAPNKAAYFVPV
jgi:hypothetical protein